MGPVDQRLSAWRWGALLAFALFAPVTLPAGGVDRRVPDVRRRSAALSGNETGWVGTFNQPDKTHRLYSDAYHFLWHDWDRELVMSDIEEWLDARSR